MIFKITTTTTLRNQEKREKGSQDLKDLHLEAEGPLRDHHQSQNLGQQETDLRMSKGLLKIDPSNNIDLVHQEIGLRKSKDLWKSKDIWKIDRLNNIDRPDPDHWKMKWKTDQEDCKKIMMI